MLLILPELKFEQQNSTQSGRLQIHPVKPCVQVLGISPSDLITSIHD